MFNVTAAAIAAAARSWIGTPHVHGQALKGVGVDCIQLVIAVYQELGWVDPGFRSQRYNRDWALHNRESILLAEMRRHCLPVAGPGDSGQGTGYRGWRTGDIMVFVYGRCASHAGIYIQGERTVRPYDYDDDHGTVVQSLAGRGVVETPLRECRGRLDSAWRIVGQGTKDG